MKELASKVFVETGEDERKVGWSSEEGDIYAEGPFFELNEDLEIDLQGDRELAALLAEVIRQWHNKRGLFCHDNTWQRKEDEDGESYRETLPEDEWGFQYKTPSTCGGCVRAQELLDKIFGSRSRFNRLPFVKFHGDRVYTFRFNLLKAFVEGGKELVEAIKEEERKEAAIEKRKKERQRRQSRLEEVSGMTDSDIPFSAQDFLLRLIERDISITALAVQNGVVLALAQRSHYAGTGGIAYYSQLHIFSDGASAEKEWQYRDRHDQHKDNFRYNLSSIGEIEINRSDELVDVEVVLVNADKYRNVVHSATLEIPEESEEQYPALSEEELTQLRKDIEEERERVRQRLEELWEHKPEMVASAPRGSSLGPSSSYQSYTRPKVNEATVLDSGVAYFTTEEQIDHRTSNRQMRHELYVMKASDSEATVVAEDHAYEGLEREAFVRVVSINPDEVVVETPDGKRTISL